MVKTREHNFQPTQSHHKVRRDVSSQLVRWTLLNYSRASPLRLWGSSTSHSSTLAYKARHSIFAQRGCGRQQGGSETNKRAPKHTQRYRFGVRILGGNTPVPSHTAQATASARHVDARGGRWERQGREVSRAEARPPPPPRRYHLAVRALGVSTRVPSHTQQATASATDRPIAPSRNVDPSSPGEMPNYSSSLRKLHESLHRDDARNLLCARDRCPGRARKPTIRLQRRPRGCTQHIPKCICARMSLHPRRTDQKPRLDASRHLAREQSRIVLETLGEL